MSLTHLRTVFDSFRSALDSAGKRMEVTQYTEKLVPSTRFVAVDGVAPTVSEASFVAPSASVIGNVTVGQESRCVCARFAFGVYSTFTTGCCRKVAFVI